MMIELKALNLHWLGENDTEWQRDLCAHSSVFLKIKDKIVSDENLGDWTVSAAAYYLLKTLTENHNEKEDPQLFPCCGFNMYAVGDNNDELLILNCPSGINWSITHKPNYLIHQFENSEIIETDFAEWRNAVCNFSDEVMSFYETSAPKIVDDDADKKGFELFIKEWKRLRAEAFK
jgi:hypothetical protein